MQLAQARALISSSILLASAARGAAGAGPPREAPRVAVTTVRPQAVTVTQEYVCRLRAHRHVDVRVPADGYVAAVPVREGQTVNKDDRLFQIRSPTDREPAGTREEDKGLAIRAPFGGMVGRLPYQQGSLVQKGETLTTLADPSVIWADFQVPESRYLESMAEVGRDRQGPDVELVLANGVEFDQPGKIGAVGADFNEAGNAVFRADFPNPNHLLRHGQAGTVRIRRVQRDAIVVPRRATFAGLDRRYVYVVANDDIARGREVVVGSEFDDSFVIKRGVGAGDRIVVEGVKLVRDGEKVAPEAPSPGPAIPSPK